VLGRLDAHAFLGGEMPLNGAAAEKAVGEKVGFPLGLKGEAGLQQAAGGILSIANLTMANAVKNISLERGYDTRDFTLIAYGGAGPLHAVQIARELHIPQVIIPPEPGNFAAVGMLLADARMDESETYLGELNKESMDEMEAWFVQAKLRAKQKLEDETGSREVKFECYAELRYRGQVHSVRTPVNEKMTAGELKQAYEDLYRLRYGHAQSSIPIELVGFHGVGAAPTGRPALEKLLQGVKPSDKDLKIRLVYFDPPHGELSASVFQREYLISGFSSAGPAVIEEYGSTTLIGPGDSFEIGKLSEIKILIGTDGEVASHG